MKTEFEHKMKPRPEETKTGRREKPDRRAAKTKDTQMENNKTWQTERQR